MARRFAVVSLDTGRICAPGVTSGPPAAELVRSPGRYRRYEVTDRHCEETHEGRMADLIARSHGDLRAAIAQLLADWAPPGGPAGFPTPPRPRGASSPMPQAA